MSQLDFAAGSSAALLLTRLVVGLLMAGHGAQKLFGWFGGHGLAGTGGFFESIGFRPGKTFALVAGLTELTSGWLVALGLLGPVGPALILSVMLVAAMTVHLKHGIFAATNGIELTAVFSAAAIALALTGPGMFSLDRALHLDQLWTVGTAWTALAVGAGGGMLNVVMRRRIVATS